MCALALSLSSNVQMFHQHISCAFTKSSPGHGDLLRPPKFPIKIVPQSSDSPSQSPFRNPQNLPLSLAQLHLSPPQLLQSTTISIRVLNSTTPFKSAPPQSPWVHHNFTLWWWHPQLCWWAVDFAPREWTHRCCVAVESLSNRWVWRWSPPVCRIAPWLGKLESDLKSNGLVLNQIDLCFWHCPKNALKTMYTTEKFRALHFRLREGFIIEIKKQLL